MRGSPVERVMVLSDLHVDQHNNMAALEEISPRAFQDTVLLVAGEFVMHKVREHIPVCDCWGGTSGGVEALSGGIPGHSPDLTELFGLPEEISVSKDHVPLIPPKIPPGEFPAQGTNRVKSCVPSTRFT